MRFFLALSAVLAVVAAGPDYYFKEEFGDGGKGDPVWGL